jgi:hypothetical protein
MTSAPGGRRFSDAVLNAVSPETRKSLHAFAESIARAEGVLREYHAAVPSAFAGQVADGTGGRGTLLLVRRDPERASSGSRDPSPGRQAWAEKIGSGARGGHATTPARPNADGGIDFSSRTAPSGRRLLVTGNSAGYKVGDRQVWALALACSREARSWGLGL